MGHPMRRAVRLWLTETAELVVVVALGDRLRRDARLWLTQTRNSLVPRCPYSIGGAWLAGR